MIRQAKGLTARAHADPAADNEARVRRAFVLSYGRLPTERELSLGLEFLSSAAPAAQGGLSPWERYAQVLLSANEFTFVD